MDGRLVCEIVGAAGSGRRTVKVSGEVDLATAPELEAQVDPVLDGASAGVALDLEALTFIDSSGLRALVALAKDAQSRGVAFSLENVPRHAQRVLELTGLADWFDFSTGG